MSIEFRPMRPDEDAFVLSSWLRGFRYSPWAGVLPTNGFFEAHRTHFTEVMATRARVVVAENTDEQPPHNLLGFIVYEPDRKPACLHWVYTKFVFRKKGVARALLYHAGFRVDDEQFIASSMTESWMQIKRGKRDRGKFMQCKHDPRYLRDPTFERGADKREDRKSRAEVPVFTAARRAT